MYQIIRKYNASPEMDKAFTEAVTRLRNEQVKKAKKLTPKKPKK